MRTPRSSFAAGPVDLPDIAALTGPDGTFVLSAPMPGEYEVAVVFLDGLVRRSTVDLAPGVAEVEVTLTR